ncbi:laminin subunit gamma-3 isoform X2 [Rhinatrema bivittatum]|uniref:laminin subunit gamma-3 isoform X2 n=1 Tax=Rhinatrema bivittatum TaxID=194408 RepID=UPI00112A21D7|nr:laminin subunit gamma-3 isoform X2 [Rhinatrema bivittatum]
MEWVPWIWLLSCLSLRMLAVLGQMDSCYDTLGKAQRCLPMFENVAFNKEVWVTNTCGSPPEDYCLQTGAKGINQLCQHCDATEPDTHHNATYLTDFHNEEEPTWWQSQSMVFGVQHPNSVNITLHLGKSYEITYIRLKFQSSRPESFAIYKRSHAGGPWIPYQYYSSSCLATYGRREHEYLRPGEEEGVAFCTQEFSDISPLRGGNVAFSTLEGRPGAYTFDQNRVLQDWVTCTDLLISLNRLNTFGDDVFRRTKDLQAYFYAISDFSVGGRCKCHGHASECVSSDTGQLVCHCQHNTMGMDCEQCLPFYQDRPWARGTAESANECRPCECHGKSDDCFFDPELYQRSGRGGHCLHCRDNTDGPHCERCRENFYRERQHGSCQPCHCNPAGSLGLQCDSSGICECKASVTGWKCERCRPGYHSFSEGGCRACACHSAGSVGTCHPQSGRCSCKQNVEGYLCDRCLPGTFNLQPDNPHGCTSCFCYGHSAACAGAVHYAMRHILSDFSRGADGWRGEDADGQDVPIYWTGSEIFLEPNSQNKAPIDFIAPGKFLGEQHFSYGQLLSLRLQSLRNETLPPAIQLVLEGAGLKLSAVRTGPLHCISSSQQDCVLLFRLYEVVDDFKPVLSSFDFHRLLANVTGLRIRAGLRLQDVVSLREVRLVSASLGLSPPAQWVEACMCPHGYTGQFCESCALGYRREIPLGGPYTSCVPCLCNQHGTCDPSTGVCHCLHNTEGPSCERCRDGFYGNPFMGNTDDCKPCPCPGQSTCLLMSQSGEVVCTNCPLGQIGRLCQICDDGFFGDPLGQLGPLRPCTPCHCNQNIDLNAVGNCDSLTGHCLRCLYNTTGKQCEKCQEGFYGDALTLDIRRKCVSCNCNRAGTASERLTCDPITGQCMCLPRVIGRDCSQCRPGFYDLQPGTGCKSCECHSVGSQNHQCHPATGQCTCHLGIEGVSCDRCRFGYFGFSVKGCRACNCSLLGSLTSQCRENGTCFCRDGFVGYKCDQCEVNFFYNPVRAGCDECPLCYTLVKAKADSLRMHLEKIQQWLQKPECQSIWGGSRQQPMLAEAPRQDQLPHAYQLQGTKDAFLQQIMDLEDSVSSTWSQLRNVSKNLSCSEGQAQKSCHLLQEQGVVLGSVQRELHQTAEMLRTLVFPLMIPNQPTNWTRLALETQKLVESHKEKAQEIESVAHRALLAAHSSHKLLQSILEDQSSRGVRAELEDWYQQVRDAQEDLENSVEKAATEAQQTSATLQQASNEMTKSLSSLASPTPLLPEREVEALSSKAKALEQVWELKDQKMRMTWESPLEASHRQLQRAQQGKELQERCHSALTLATSSVSDGKIIATGAKSILSDLKDMWQMLVYQKAQMSASRRKMEIIQDRMIINALKKTRQAERMLGNSTSLSLTAKKMAQEAERSIRETLQGSRDLVQEVKQEHGHPSDLAKRASGSLQEILGQLQASKILEEKLEEAEKAKAGMKSVKKMLQDAWHSLELDKEALSDLLAALGTLGQDGPSSAGLSQSWAELDLLQQHLARSGALDRTLQRLQQEAEQQRLKIQEYEQEIDEIQAEKLNLEDIVRTLPKGCSV